MLDYMVSMDVQVRPDDFREDIAVELVEALEQDARALGPVTAENAQKHRVSATFGVWAHGVLDAFVIARAVMLEALERIGARQPMEVTGVQIVAYEDLGDWGLDPGQGDEGEPSEGSS